MNELEKAIEKLKGKTFTSKQLDDFCFIYGWIYTQCDNEKNGEFCEGITTYQIQADEDEDYFGEFVGNDEDGYTYNDYE